MTILNIVLRFSTITEKASSFILLLDFASVVAVASRAVSRVDYVVLIST